jgi:hypothetical protein
MAVLTAEVTRDEFLHLAAMAELDREELPIDPEAVQAAYRVHRARRVARQRHRRRQRLAGVRFWVVLVVLVGGSAALALTIYREIQSLFGI